MDNDKVAANLKVAEIKWNALQWHKATLMAKIAKIEKDTLSWIKQVPDHEKGQYSDSKVEMVYADAGKCTPEQLDARMEHYYLTMEYLDLLANIRATEDIVKEYSSQVDRTKAEEEAFIPDKMIHEKLKQIDGLKIKSAEQKALTKGLHEAHQSHLANPTKFTKTDRYEFFKALENHYNNNL